MTLFKKAWLPLSLTFLSLAATLSGTAVTFALRYEREAILAGQAWRLVTGNLVQAGLSHWLLNILGLWLVWLLFPGPTGRVNGLWVACVAGLATTLGLLWFSPDVRWYVGLSGLLHGLLAGALVASLPGAERRLALAVGLLLILKLTYEQHFGPLPGSEAASGVPVVVDAHLYGSIGGLTAGLFGLGQAALRRR